MKPIKNILMVYPEIPASTYWSFVHALKFINKKTALPPLGLATIASIIPDKYNIKIIDMNIENLTKKDVENSDAVFVSAMIVQKESMQEVLKMCRDLNRPSVLGGPYAETAYDENEPADYFMTGEAENILEGFLSDLEQNKASKIYRCIEKPDMKESVIPRFDLLKLKEYASMAVQYSRGCPFHCEFCDIWIKYGNKPRLKTAANLLAEFDELYRLGWRQSIFLVDDNFIGNKKRLKNELLPELIKWQEKHGHPFRLYTEASINMAEDEELMNLMAEAGLDQVFVGIETPSEEALEETGKSQNLKENLLDSVIKIQKHGLEVTAGFILGFDSEKEDIFQRQIDFIQKSGIPKAMIGLIQALPGTLLYDRLEKEGRLKGSSSGSNTHSLSTNVATIMDESELRQGYKKVLEHIYDSSMKNYFKRCDDLLTNLNNTSYIQRKIRLHEIRAFLLSITVQPFKPYGFEYLKFIFKTLKKNPSLFAEAISHSVMGHHFYVITKQMLKAEKVSDKLDNVYKEAALKIYTKSQIFKTTASGHAKALNLLRMEYMKKMKKISDKINDLPSDFQKDIRSKYSGVYKSILNILSEEESRITHH
ncbi:MAG: B12-binding domain-containing radical SAM protein [Thermodesulfobacteriota bacterium]